MTPADVQEFEVLFPRGKMHKWISDLISRREQQAVEKERERIASLINAEIEAYKTMPEVQEYALNARIFALSDLRTHITQPKT
jgi:hypothetical protein